MLSHLFESATTRPRGGSGRDHPGCSSTTWRP